MYQLMKWITERARIVGAFLLFCIPVVLLYQVLRISGSNLEMLAIYIASISAIFAAVSSFATLLQAIEMQKQRRNLERPYIIADFDIASDGEISFITQNIGNSPAFDLLIKFEEPVPINSRKKPLGFLSPVKFFPPGKSMKQIWDYPHNIFKEDSPAKYRFTITYASIFHDAYKEIIEQDISFIKDIVFPERTIQQNLEHISRDIGSIAMNLRPQIFGPPQKEVSLAKIANELNLIRTQRVQKKRSPRKKVNRQT